VASDAKAFENDDETVLDESALLESEERSDSEPVTPPAAPVATSAPEPAQQANVQAATQPAAIPKRLFTPCCADSASCPASCIARSCRRRTITDGSCCSDAYAALRLLSGCLKNVTV
jgi:hypothetical protein